MTRPTIRILRGSDAAIHRYLEDQATSSDSVLWVPCEPDRVQSWNGLRGLFGQTAEHLGEDRFTEIVSRHAAAASLVLDGIPFDLDDRRRAERDGLAARPTSHLSHNWAIQRPLFDRWAEILHDLVSGRGFTLLLPSLPRIDWESIAVLKALYRRFPDSAPDLVAGFDPEAPAPRRNEDGLTWLLLPPYVIQVVFNLQRLAGAETVDVPDDGGPPEPGRSRASSEARSLPSEPRFEGIEVRALRDLQAHSGEPDPEVRARAVAAMRACFRRFGFTAAVRLGLELLAREPHLEPEQRADVHGIVGLAAHNRQFRTAGNLELADFLRRHFTAALEAETRPALRCALLYRLAVTLGRRQGDLPAALTWAQQAVSEAQEAELPPLQAAHLEAWARNIRSYVAMRQRRNDDALDDSEAAFRRLAEARERHGGDEASLGESWSRELVASQSLLASNLSVLHWLDDDLETAHSWRRTASDLERDHPGAERFEASAWIDICRALYRLDLALPRALSGLESARLEDDGFWEFRYTLEAADLHYRLGDPETAREHFLDALELRRRFGDPDFLTSPEPGLAAACLRAGRPEEARRRLARALEDGERPIWQRAEILSLTALARIAEDRAEEAEERINEAIDLAVESGERDALLRVAITAGQVAQSLGRRREAREAYGKAVEIAGEEAPAGDLSAALVGLAECAPGERQPALRALKLLPAALEDPESWWNLARLLAVLASVAEDQPDALAAEELEDSLRALGQAASQRPDCVAGLAALRRLAPTPHP